MHLQTNARHIWPQVKTSSFSPDITVPFHCVSPTPGYAQKCSKHLKAPWWSHDLRWRGLPLWFCISLPSNAFYPVLAKQCHTVAFGPASKGHHRIVPHVPLELFSGDGAWEFRHAKEINKWLASKATSIAALNSLNRNAFLGIGM